ncbi:hypothetical protein ACPXB3_05875 [Gordonia sp. DT219]|uniref:hypothetical protein n=1 Tax=Gordonia sp. DT219 TaxID=3416658 RepID=UPI003CF17A9C
MRIITVTEARGRRHATLCKFREAESGWRLVPAPRSDEQAQSMTHTPLRGGARALAETVRGDVPQGHTPRPRVIEDGDVVCFVGRFVVSASVLDTALAGLADAGLTEFDVDGLRRAIGR